MDDKVNCCSLSLSFLYYFVAEEENPVVKRERKWFYVAFLTRCNVCVHTKRARAHFFFLYVAAEAQNTVIYTRKKSATTQREFLTTRLMIVIKPLTVQRATRNSPQQFHRSFFFVSVLIIAHLVRGGIFQDFFMTRAILNLYKAKVDVKILFFL